jgi:hypothetical protein
MWRNCVSACDWGLTSFDFVEELARLFIKSIVLFFFAAF